jgi:hypothetical protein
MGSSVRTPRERDGRPRDIGAEAFFNKFEAAARKVTGSVKTERHPCQAGPTT